RRDCSSSAPTVRACIESATRAAKPAFLGRLVILPTWRSAPTVEPSPSPISGQARTARRPRRLLCWISPPAGARSSPSYPPQRRRLMLRLSLEEHAAQVFMITRPSCSPLRQIPPLTQTLTG